MALDKINFFFGFLPPIFFEALVHYHKQHVYIWDIFIAFWHISIVYFVLLNFSRKCKFELQVHRIMDYIRSKNVILVS